MSKCKSLNAARKCVARSRSRSKSPISDKDSNWRQIQIKGDGDEEEKQLRKEIKEQYVSSRVGDDNQRSSDLLAAQDHSSIRE